MSLKDTKDFWFNNGALVKIMAFLIILITFFGVVGCLLFLIVTNQTGLSGSTLFTFLGMALAALFSFGLGILNFHMAIMMTPKGPQVSITPDAQNPPTTTTIADPHQP